jgi:sodium transport system ATP-binding protein
MIETQHLVKSFGSIQALKDVSFIAANGQITGLLGPNGAGKTTCLRILYGVIQPDQGSAQIDGFDTQKQTRLAQQRIGALPDSQGLYPRLTARENIRYYGRLQGLTGKPLEENIQELVNILDMQDIIDRRTEGFSSGQRVKVAIARAIIHQPENILLDEPTNGLDVMSTRAMRTVIRQLRDEGKCVLFSSHIMQEVTALCDQIIIISKGEIVTCGSPEDILKETGMSNLEDAFAAAIGTEAGLE